MILDIFQPNLNIKSSYNPSLTDFTSPQMVNTVNDNHTNNTTNLKNTKLAIAINDVNADNTSPVKRATNPSAIKSPMKSPFEFKKLSDEKLTEYLGSLFHKEKQIGDCILLVLKELKSRRIYAALGYSSLFEMLVKHFHLSETSSYQRLNALKLMESVPAAAKEIFKGDLSLTNAAAVQSYIFRSEKEQNKPMSVNEKTELITAVKNKSTKEAQQILAAINPAAVVPKQKEKIITDQFTQLQILVDQETLAQLKQVQSLLSHKIPDGDYNQILKLMATEMIVILQKRKGIYNKGQALYRDGNITEFQKNEFIKKEFDSIYLKEDKTFIHAESENTIAENQNNIKPKVLLNMSDKTPPMAGKQSVVKLDLKKDQESKQDQISEQEQEQEQEQDQEQDKESRKNQNQEPNQNENNFRNSIQIRNQNQNLIKNINFSKNKKINPQKNNNQLIKTSSKDKSARYISASTKGRVYTDAQNRCQYISADGKRCNSQHQLEIDHINPISLGGSNQETNLQLLCRVHNQYRTKQTHGFWY